MMKEDAKMEIQTGERERDSDVRFHSIHRPAISKPASDTHKQTDRQGDGFTVYSFI